MAQSETDGDNWDLVAYVTSSKYRMAIVESLTESPRRPSDVDGFDVAHISRAMNELRDKGVIDLLVSEDVKKGRYYGLTDQGVEIAEQIEGL